MSVSVVFGPGSGNNAGPVNLASGVTGVLPVINGGTGLINVSGTYVPLLFNTTNVAASTAGGCMYAQVGSMVFIAGGFLIDPTLSGVATVLGFALPIPSNFNDTSQVSGVTVTQDGATLQAGAIYGDVPNKRGFLRYISNDLAQRFFNFQCMYLVV